MIRLIGKLFVSFFSAAVIISFTSALFAADADVFISKEERVAKREARLKELQKEFVWWPSDARPSPVMDAERGGYWWWPVEPGQVTPWGNRGYVYVYKIIFDYRSDELEPPEPQEMRPSLLIKKLVKNIKIYFDYDKSDLRDDAKKILDSAVWTLGRNPDCSILITGNCDIRGTERYNEKLGRCRAEAVRKFMLENGISQERIRIISRGKLDAVAPVTDLVGMQKDRNAQFMIAEVEEIMLPYSGRPEISGARQIEENKFFVEEEKKVEGEIRVRTREYTVKQGDTLAKIAKTELGGKRGWQYLYNLNRDRIKDPNNLKVGTKILIPAE